VLEGLAARLGRPVSELLGSGVELLRNATELREEVGAYTFEDILRELEKPGRDPRDSFVPFSFREDVRVLEDLKPGLLCPGVVTNVTNFGAFVDVGVHQDGLVHISQLGDRFVKDPRGVVKPGDRVQVRVLKVDLDKKQISLSMRSAPPERKAAPERKAGRAPARKPKPPRAAPVGKGPAPPRPPRPEAGPPPSGGAAAARKGPPPPRSERGPAPPARRSPPPPSSRPPAQPAFNNPFAVLAKLKDPRKS
jgi:uncharacterized protein